MSLQFQSTAFPPEKEIPVKYSCNGEDHSPPLKWSAGPLGTKSWAIIVDDPDAPNGTWVHWVVYNIPANVTDLKENISPKEKLADGTCQGVNDFGVIGFRGPCPPPGKPHRYFFKLYALDIVLSLPPKQTKEQLLQAMKDHILGEVSFLGKFQR